MTKILNYTRIMICLILIAIGLDKEYIELPSMTRFIMVIAGILGLCILAMDWLIHEFKKW